MAQQTTRPHTVNDCMTRRVVTVEMDDSLDVIAGIYRRVSFHHLLVVSDETLVGVISDRDFFRATSPYLDTLSETDRDRATLNKRAHQIMTRRPMTIHDTAPIEEAARLLLTHRISCLPVLDTKGNLTGILTWVDLLKAFIGQPSADATPQ